MTEEVGDKEVANATNCRVWMALIKPTFFLGGGGLFFGGGTLWIFLKIVGNSNFDFWQRAEITLASSITVLQQLHWLLSLIIVNLVYVGPTDFKTE